ncbi:MAG: hypothetical protein ACRELB_27480 [Polyangiaceae bacterium]
MVDPAELPDREPTSEIRPVDGRARRLLVDTGLRGTAAEGAWVTVTDDAGAGYFEGSPSADGCVEVSFDDAPGVSAVRILLETATSHRQAQVTLGSGWTSHAFV